MYLKQARQEKKGNNGRIWASPTTQECTQVYVLECTLAPTWKYKNVLVVVVEKNTKSNRILNFDLWISHVKDGQQWSCSVSSGKKLPTATAYDQSYAVRTRHNNHHPGWMLVSEEFKNPCSEQLTWINSRVLGETDTLPVRERICEQIHSVSWMGMNGPLAHGPLFNSP